MACLLGHKWNGCKCEKCGKTRDINHSWKEAGNCYKICTICKESQKSHKWAQKGRSLKCEKCGVFGGKIGKWPEFESAVTAALNHFGDAAYDFPYVFRSLEKKMQGPDLILDAHEIIGVHGLLTGFWAALTQMASPVAGGMMMGKTPNKNSLLSMDAAFKLRNDVTIYLKMLQGLIGENSKDVMQINTPAIKEKLAVYLNE